MKLVEIPLIKGLPSPSPSVVRTVPHRSPVLPSS